VFCVEPQILQVTNFNLCCRTIDFQMLLLFTYLCVNSNTGKRNRKWRKQTEIMEESKTIKNSQWKNKSHSKCTEKHL